MIICTAIVLTKQLANGLLSIQSLLSERRGMKNTAEAEGNAVHEAQEKLPDYQISLVSSLVINVKE